MRKGVNPHFATQKIELISTDKTPRRHIQNEMLYM